MTDADLQAIYDGWNDSEDGIIGLLRAVRDQSVAAYRLAVPPTQSTEDAQPVAIYPDELTAELREVLGWPNFRCGPFAHLMVAAGADIKPRAEDEQAAVLHWLIKLVLKHGDKWGDAADASLAAMRETIKAKGQSS